MISDSGYNGEKVLGGLSGDREKFQKLFKPSAFFINKLDIFSDLLLKWQKKTNLISRSTEPFLWQRHFLDSAQLYWHLDRSKASLIDLGSGAGFPGLVLAIMFLEFGGPQVHLVESNKRKATFLFEADRLLGTQIKIQNARIESIQNLKGDIITARALASLDHLIRLSQKFANADTVFFFLKGKKFKQELTVARKNWNMKVEEIESITSPAARILKLLKVKPVDKIFKNIEHQL